MKIGKRSQGGAALIVVFSLLVVSTVIGVTGFQNARFEERMSANQRFSIAAFQAAEAGISDVVVSLRDNFSPVNPIECVSGAEVGGPLPSAQKVSFSAAGFLGASYEYWMECEGDSLVGFSRGEIDMGDDTPPVARLIKLYLQPPSEGIDSETYYGIKAHGDIVLRGMNTINGNIHTNSNLTINNVDGDAIGAITASGNVTISGKGPEVVDAGGECGSVMCAVSNYEPMDIESASDKIDSVISEWGGTSLFVDLIEVNGTCDLSLSGDKGGEIYYCSDPGKEMVVNGSFNNATLLARGGIEHLGQSNLGDYDDSVDGPDSIDTQLIAVGDIKMRGADDSYLVLWSDSDVIQSGTSTLFGSIIAGGTVTRAGGIKFSSWDSYEGITFNRVRRFGNLLYWVEMEGV